MNTSKSSLKRWFIYGIIGSLVASAAMGILVLLQGTFDDIDWKILGTTGAVGLFSITSLASLRTLESVNSGLRTFSRLSILASGLAFMFVAMLVWTNWSDDSDFWWKAAAVAAVVAVSMAHASLLMPLIEKPGVLPTIILLTLVFITTVAGMVIYLILESDLDHGDLYYRLLGVFAILDVLGTIVGPLMAKFMSKQVAGEAVAAARLKD